MIIAWVVFVVGAICTIVWLSSMFLDSREERIKRHSVGNFWLWLIITTCSAQYIWG